MVKMPEDLVLLLNEWHTIPVATVGKEGKPNVAGKSLMVRDNESLIWGELYFMQTYENLLQNPVASICVWQRKPPYKAYKMNGRVEIHEDDAVADQLNEHMRMGHGADFKPRKKKMAAVVFLVEEIYDQTPRLESGGKRIM
ncbi:MAG: pyridoxamine 5'-phosphate oxidase family protein [Methanomicrobiales archaeon]|nr:pyridoxamine 5'-phosphate oxidase family protein [Methanomicrobiales archaeon]